MIAHELRRKAASPGMVSWLQARRPAKLKPCPPRGEPLAVQTSPCPLNLIHPLPTVVIMNTKSKARSILCLAVSIAICLLAGCGSPPASNSAAPVPDVVQRTFQEKFPAVKLVEWKLKPDHNYEAEFTLGETEISAKFDPVGKWLETESAIPPGQVPQSVHESAVEHFNGYHAVETQTVERWNDQRSIYELHLDNGQEIAKVLFSADGTVLNQSAKAKDAASSSSGDGK